MLELELEVCGSPVDAIAGGRPEHGDVDIAELPAGALVRSGERSMAVTSEGGTVRVRGRRIVVSRRAIVRDGDWATLDVELEFDDPAVDDRASTVELSAPPLTGRPALDRWTARAVSDIETLLLDVGHGPVPAASAPWRLGILARDAIGAARLLLPVDPRPAAGVLHTLAAHQGVRVDAGSGEEPGRMPHALERGGDYRSLDATPAWIVLLHDAWRAGMPLDAVRELRPALHASLAWMIERIGEGYLGRTATGPYEEWLPPAADDGDAREWFPVDAQALAHAAAAAAAELLTALGDDGDGWRAWAERLRERFRADFWIEDGAERRPAAALDADREPVDALTAAIGHLPGSGLLDADEEEAVARLLLDPRLSSGFGLRSLDAASPDHWPLAPHGGAVWPHETAVAIDGLLRAGLGHEARALAEQLERAAAALDGRLPRVLAGYGLDESAVPVPLPGACGVAAWAAAGAFAVHRAVTTRDVAAPRDIHRRRVVIGADGGPMPVLLTGLAPRSPHPRGSDAGGRGALRIVDGGPSEMRPHDD